jgi:hypothetical protein
LSWASSSVRPTMGVKVQKNFIDAGSRPASLASLRMLAIFGARTDGSWPVTKMASACLDANDDPALFDVSQVTPWARNGALTAKFPLGTRTVFVVGKDLRYAESPN